MFNVNDRVTSKNDKSLKGTIGEKFEYEGKRIYKIQWYSNDPSGDLIYTFEHESNLLPASNTQSNWIIEEYKRATARMNQIPEYARPVLNKPDYTKVDVGDKVFNTGDRVRLKYGLFTSGSVLYLVDSTENTYVIVWDARDKDGISYRTLEKYPNLVLLEKAGSEQNVLLKQALTFARPYVDKAVDAAFTHAYKMVNRIES